MFAALILQATSPIAGAVTLEEAKSMSPSALGDRLLSGRTHGPIVDAIVNGRGLAPPSSSVNRVWLVEQMVPFDGATCRSHVFEIEMASAEPNANVYANALPTHPSKIEEYDRLWVPTAGSVTTAVCAAVPAMTSGFATGNFSLQQAADLVRQARYTFLKMAKSGRVVLRCRGERGTCGIEPRVTLSKIDWGLLGLVKEVDAKGESFPVGGPLPVRRSWGASHVQFTFPYAASNGSTWVITVDRKPEITTVRMSAQMIIYH